jgi:hypothetical protein
MSKSKWPRAVGAFGLVCNLAGTGCLAWSFQATSSQFRLITAENLTSRGRPNPNGKAYSVCADMLELTSVDTTQSVSAGTGRCALWELGKPAAIVVSDQPHLLELGLGLFAVGFLLQLLLLAL